MVDNSMDKLFVALLDSANRELVFTSGKIGVFKWSGVRTEGDCDLGGMWAVLNVIRAECVVSSGICAECGLCRA